MICFSRDDEVMEKDFDIQINTVDHYWAGRNEIAESYVFECWS